MPKSERTEDERQLVRYLLGQLSAEQRTHIEQQYLGDPAFLGRLESVESDLIEGYLNRELSGAEKLSFEEQYLANPERRRKVEWTAALIHRPRKEPRFSRLQTGFRYGLVAALLCVTIAVSALYYTNRLPSPALLEPGGTSRSLGLQAQRVLLGRQSAVVRLRLDLGGSDSARIDHVTLRTIEEESPVWSEKVPRLSSAAFLDLIIQSSVLENRDYILSLEAGSETLASYSFRIQKD